MVTSILSISTYGQNKDYIPLRISVFNESTSIPFTTIIPKPIHPGIQMGVSRQWNTSQSHYFYQTANLSYFFHNHLYQAVTVSSELGYDYRFKFGLNLKTLFGIGYMMAMNTQQAYEFVNGDYRKTNNTFMSKAQATLSLGLGYRINPKDNGSPEIFALYQAGAIYPFSSDFIPAMTQTNFHIGISIPIKINK